ncbi:MAG: EAL domain-containing protein [Lachnospiraceae bacterium]|nr:EAL domain-containing protein [Lachnospiraceae bacterium]
MGDLKITQDMVYPEFSSNYLNVFDYRYAEGRHYYNATRRNAENLVATKDEKEFKDMIPDAVSCIVIVDIPGQEPRLLLDHEFRYPAGRSILSVPAGLIDKDDQKSDNPIVSAAIREIREETGIEIGQGDRISIVNPLLFSTPGLTDESNAIVCAHVHLKDMSGINDSGTEESEHIGGYMLITVEKACEYVNKGCDEYGYYYSVFTWIALNYFINESKRNKWTSEALDSETGFLSRVGFYNFLTDILAAASLRKRNVVLLGIKLVNYKRISELWAVSESSNVINASAKLISDVLRGRAVCARVDEDTYMIVTETDDDGLKAVNSIKEQLSSSFDRFNKLSSKDYTLNPAISSMTVAPDSGFSPDEVFARMSAKTRELLDSKPHSRYAAMREGEKDPELRSIINRILDTNDIDYYFQPIISAKTGDIIGYEALMRMPEKYGVSPLTLLKYATEENRLGDVERATLFNVLKKMTEMKDELGDRKVFINSIPGHYLPEDEFSVLAEKYGHLLEKVVIEVTEETDMEEETIDFLSSRSKKYGFQVAVDDFGTGYSNVTNLLKFLPNYVKIDRFLISELQIDPRKQHFVNTIIQFAHDNGFQALAEGVETSEELNAAIRMGSDLIQGFFTAKPHPKPLQTLPQQLLSEISRANLDMVSNNSRQKVYLVKDEKHLSLVDLSLQKYNVLLLSGGDLTLVGNPEFLSAISIRIKDHAHCRLTIRDVSIGDVDTTPCIDLGKESSLVLNIEGNNVFTGNGIRVPGSAELMLTGTGNLKIEPTFTNAYGIGNDYLYAFGRIVSEMTGLLEINISGENCICIGGKTSENERAIDLRSGVFKSICAASNCVCIGSHQDRLPIYISNMDLSIDVRVNKGAMIGSMYGDQDTHISNTALCIFGAGNHVTGIGSTEKVGGAICINDCSVDIPLRGWNVTAIGAIGGNLSIDCRHCRVLLKMEGNIATGMGCRDCEAVISIDNVAVDMSIFSANGILFGCSPDAFSDNLNSFDIKRDGFDVEKKNWFGRVVSGDGNA